MTIPLKIMIEGGTLDTDYSVTGDGSPPASAVSRHYRPVHADLDAKDLSFELGDSVREECDFVHTVRSLKILIEKHGTTCAQFAFIAPVRQGIRNACCDLGPYPYNFASGNVPCDGDQRRSKRHVRPGREMAGDLWPGLSARPRLLRSRNRRKRLSIAGETGSPCRSS